MLTPRKDTEGMDLNNTYQYYMQWRQKRLDVQEKVKSKLNESVSGPKAKQSMIQPEKSGEELSPRTIRHHMVRLAEQYEKKRSKFAIEGNDSQRPFTERGGKFEDYLNTQFSSFLVKNPEEKQISRTKLKENLAEMRQKLRSRSPLKQPGRNTVLDTGSPISRLKKDYELAKRKVSAQEANVFNSYLSGFGANIMPRSTYTLKGKTLSSYDPASSVTIK